MFRIPDFPFATAVRPLLFVITLLTTTSLSLAANPAINSDKTGLALSGYDPVSYFTDQSPAKGSFKITAEYDGVVYRFISVDHRDAFTKAPDRYLPQFGGYCAYGVSVGKKFSADPTVWIIHEGKLYLNLDTEIFKAFTKDLQGNIAKAQANWQAIATAGNESVNTDQTGLAIEGYDPVSYFTMDQPVKGSFQITAEYGGAVYRFVNEKNRKAFVQQPSRYLPQCGGYCAYGIAVGAKFSADPTVYRIVDDKLYLNLDPSIAAEFNKNPKDYIAKAEKNWPTLAEKPANK